MNDIIKLTYQRNGEEIKTMEFIRVKGCTMFVSGSGYEWKNNKADYYMIKGTQHLNIFITHCIRDYTKYHHININDDVTESINPLYLEFITSKECSECKGKGEYLEQESWDVTDKELVKCLNCKSGKVEVVTQKTFFGDSLTKYVHDQITGFLKVCVKTDKEEHGYFGSLEFMEKVVEELKESK